MTENTDNDQETRLRAIRDRGAREFYANRTEFNCPFDFGTAEYNEYERGWTQALKRAPSNSLGWVSSNWEPSPEPKPYELPKVNEYARRKG
ncbi:hypothetical protein JAO85_20900 [Comamonas sp. NyZ500]|uniref:hypothetical protein n=1 Tax=Comamonas sp. NyZ500 TaxID=2795732 RepID=UPI00192B90C3|nr:hypothetical protein [Comamonas sp. NyZ500]MBL5979740.1 hypothetical protein [Comamonas sp. NyZ500]